MPWPGEFPGKHTSPRVKRRASPESAKNSMRRSVYVQRSEEPSRRAGEPQGGESPVEFLFGGRIVRPAKADELLLGRVVSVERSTV